MVAVCDCNLPHKLFSQEGKSVGHEEHDSPEIYGLSPDMCLYKEI